MASLNEFENITELSFYIEGKIELINYIKKLKEISDKNILEIKLKYFYDPPELLIDTDLDKRHDFLNHPHHDHEIFGSIKIRISIIKDIKASLKDRNETIEGILDRLSKGYNNSIDYFVKNAPLGFKIFNEKVILMTEDLKFREITIDKAYKICSYDKDKLKFNKINKKGVSLGIKDDNIYYKNNFGLDVQNKLYLRPLMEYIIRSFYSSVLKFNKFNIISPTQLIVIWGLPIFDETSNEKKQFHEIKDNFCIKVDKEVHKILPYTKNIIQNGFKIKRPMIIQANLFQEGGDLDELLNLQSMECTDRCESLRKFYDKLSELSNNETFMYSYSGHIIGSLLLITSDAKSDNLIYNENLNLIIGIDNDRFLDQEIKKGCDNKMYLKFKNVLFTIKGLMTEPINKDIRESIINSNPYELIFGWLLNIYNQELLFNKLFQSFIYLNDHDYNDDVVSKKIRDLKANIKIPFKIQTDAIKSILDKFIKIKSILNRSGNVTHMMLFQDILPLSHYYYQYISNIKSSSIEQMSYIFNKDIDCYPKVDYIKEIISNYDFNSRMYKISINVAIQNFIGILKVGELLEYESTFLNIIKFIICVADKSIINQKTKFDQSWYSLINKWIIQIIISCNEGELGDILERLFKIFNIKSTHLNNDLPKPIIYEIVEMVKRNENQVLTSKIITSICILINHGANIDKLYMDNSALDLINENRNQKIFQILVKNGASIVKPNNISDYYQSLSIDEKIDYDNLFKILSSVNSQVSWAIPFNHLFIKSVAPPTNDKDMLYFNNGISIDSRIISTKYSDSSIDDSLHKIHLNFQPLLPSNHIIYNLFYKLLFKIKLPHSDFVILNGQPVLLKQSIEGRYLNELNDDELSKLNQSSVSKLIIMEILFYRVNCELSDFVVDSNNNVIPIENCNSFLPISSFKNENFILPDSCIFLLNQIKDNVPDDVKSLILKKDMMDLLKTLLTELQTIHCNWGSLFFKHFNNQISKDILNDIFESKTSILGVLFYKNQINKLYSRLIHLQNLLKNNPTHLSILKEMVSPLVSSKYENLFHLSHLNSFEKRCEFIQQLNQNQLDILNILGIQDINIINKSFKENSDPNHVKNINITSYEPSNALEQLYDIAKQEKLIEPLFYDQINFKSNAKRINIINIKNFDRVTIEYFLKQQKRHQDNSIDKQRYIIELLFQCKIHNKELKSIKLKNNNQLQSHHLNGILTNSLIKLNISNCNNIDFTHFNQNIFRINFNINNNIKLSNVQKIILNNNSNLVSIKLIAPKLKSFSSSGSERLEELDLQSPELEFMKLSNGTLHKKSKVFESIQTKSHYYKKLKSIDITNNNKLDFMFKKDFNICFNEFTKNNTQVIYDEYVFKIGIFESYHHYFNDTQKSSNRNEVDLAIKLLTDQEFIRDKRNEPKKKNFNKLHNYNNSIVHIDYRFNYAFTPYEKINYGLIAFNPNNFDINNLRSIYYRVNCCSNINDPPFILFGISKLNGNDHCIQLLETLKQDCTVIYKFNVTQDDENDITNELLSYISNPIKIIYNNNNIFNNNRRNKYNNHINKSNNNNNNGETLNIINNYYDLINNNNDTNNNNFNIN